MSKKLWCVKQGGRVVEATDGTKYWEKKTDAKVTRDSFQGEYPESPDVATSWQYRVSRGPDHWLSLL